MDREQAKRELIHMVLFAIVFAWGYFAAASGCKAGELYVVSTVKSYHQDRDHHYNEKNLGIGLELKANDNWSFVAGEYKNSFYNKTNYVGIGFTPFHEGAWSAGCLVVAVSGYDFKDTKKFLVVAVPVISYQWGKLLINSVIVPPIYNMGMIGVQLGWRFI